MYTRVRNGDGAGAGAGAAILFSLPEMKKPACAGFFPRTPDGLATPASRISC
jgi:hypothetical protein